MFKSFRKNCLAAIAAITIPTLVLPVSGEQPELEAIAKPLEPTIVVSHVEGSPKASGKALLEAMKAARLATGDVTVGGAKTRHLTILLEPGVYDVGRASVRLAAGVDIEGSGVGETEIVGLGQSLSAAGFSFDHGVIVGADGSELRHLSVRCVNTPELDACITMANHRASPRIRHVRLTATSPDGVHWGLRNTDSSPLLSDVDIVVANGRNNYGVVNVLPGSQPEIRRTTITAADASGDNVGIFNKLEALPARLVDVEIGAMNGRRAIGVLTFDPGELAVTGPEAGDVLARQTSSARATMRLINVEIGALDADRNFGFLKGAYTLEMRQSRVVSDDSAIDIGPLGDVDVAASELRASRFLVRANSVRITGSTLLGGGEVQAYGDAECSGIRTEDGTFDVCP